MLSAIRIGATEITTGRDLIQIYNVRVVSLEFREIEFADISRDLPACIADLHLVGLAIRLRSSEGDTSEGQESNNCQFHPVFSCRRGPLFIDRGIRSNIRKLASFFEI